MRGNNTGFLICLLLCMACSDKAKHAQTLASSEAAAAKFTAALCGDWFCVIESDTIFEGWSRENDSTFKGLSYTASGDEKVLEEIILLRNRQGRWAYCPTVYGENDGEEVCFTLQDSDSSFMLFGNSKHDFPKSIEYRFTGENALDATLGGQINGKDTAIIFKLFKIPAF